MFKFSYSIKVNILKLFNKYLCILPVDIMKNTWVLSFGNININNKYMYIGILMYNSKFTWFDSLFLQFVGFTLLFIIIMIAFLSTNDTSARLYTWSSQVFFQKNKQTKDYMLIQQVSVSQLLSQVEISAGFSQCILPGICEHVIWLVVYIWMVLGVINFHVDINKITILHSKDSTTWNGDWRLYIHGTVQCACNLWNLHLCDKLQWGNVYPMVNGHKKWTRIIFPQFRNSWTHQFLLQCFIMYTVSAPSGDIYM